MPSSRIRTACVGLIAALLPLAVLPLGVLPQGLGMSAAQAGNWDGISTWETAYVTRIVDGDTLIVADVLTNATSRIRLLGINAPEKPNGTHPGQCGGLEATQALTDILPVGTLVRLLSSDPNSKGKADRPQRVVLTQNPESKEFDQDIAWGMAERGWGLWFTVAKEASMSSIYRDVIARAQEQKIGIWNPQLCGELEQPEASIDLKISRGTSASDEWVIVRNSGSADVDVSGWTIRDSGNQGWIVLPGGSILSPGDYRVVHTGSKPPLANDPRALYANLKTRLYPEPIKQPYLFGDGVYMLDRNGNYRFWRQYPCTIDCENDPLNGSVIIEDMSLGKKKGTTRASTQWLRLLNRSAETQCLDGYRIETGNTRYRLPSGTCLPPGGTWIMHGGKGINSMTSAYLNRRTPVFWLSGTATLLSDQDQVIARRSW
jgi:endonuclease YncB( thermonuclease family)